MNCFLIEQAIDNWKVSTHRSGAGGTSRVDQAVSVVREKVKMLVQKESSSRAA